MGAPLPAAAGVDGVQFVAHHRDGTTIIEAQRPGAGDGADVPSCGEHAKYAV
jgi:hypothetical protein